MTESRINILHYFPASLAAQGNDYAFYPNLPSEEVVQLMFHSNYVAVSKRIPRYQIQVGSMTAIR